jgi:ribonucleoside-diphosphate reductase alpha chain
MDNINITVKKRDGTKEEFDINKINQILTWAIEGIKDVSVSDIVLKAQFTGREVITSKQIHKILIEAAVECLTLQTLNYQWVASRLVNFSLRKEVWGGVNPPKFYDFLQKSVKLGIYDPIILETYSEKEINKLDEYIQHDRDFTCTYAGIKQLCDKYLLQNRKTKKLYETPQFAYMAIAMTVFRNEDKENRLKRIKSAYDAYSKFKINLPTPQLAGLRTPLRAYSSCCLIDVGDSMDSILASASAVGKATAQRYGIGINMGRIRGIGSEIRKGEVLHTGVIPFLKVYEALTKSCQQNGVRGGGGTVSYPFWHYEVEDLLVLKNNGGTEESRARKLDYTIQFSKLFFTRFLEGGTVTLFSPHQVPDLYEAFGTPEFDVLYKKYEDNYSLAPMRKKVPAKELMSLFVKERVETGRIYTLFLDHIQAHSAWAVKVPMSNLCNEVCHPTKPINDINDAEGEIGVCVLAAVNWGEVELDEFPEIMEIIVRTLEHVIDIQDYFCPAAENFTRNRRSLGIGINNLAAFLAKNKLKYTDPEAAHLVDRYMEYQQYYLLKASVQLAKEKGACAKFNETKYSKGILPIDTYKKDVDSVTRGTLELDWEELRGEIMTHGLRHSTLTAIMPCESSSVVSNSTNGIEPPRAFLSYKKSKMGTTPVIVPDYDKYKKYYSLAYEIGNNKAIINIVAAISKYLDMCVSTNLYYDYNDYPDGKLPDIDVIKDIAYAYKMGVPSLYYNNTNEDMDMDKIENTDSCAGGACTI